MEFIVDPEDVLICSLQSDDDAAEADLIAQLLEIDSLLQDSKASHIEASRGPRPSASKTQDYP
eukprot:1529038-Rhodomonas_salina.3